MALPSLVLVVGVAGSGKTVLSRALAEALPDAALLSKDLVQRPFLDGEDVFTADRERDALLANASQATYDVLVAFADLQLGLGKTPVIDAPFSFNHNRRDRLRDWVAPFRRVADAHDAPLRIIRCRPPGEKEHRRRLEARGSARDAWKLAHWEEFVRTEPVDFPIAHDDVLELVTGGADLARRAEEYLRGPGLSTGRS